MNVTHTARVQMTVEVKWPGSVNGTTTLESLRDLAANEVEQILRKELARLSVAVIGPAVVTTISTK